MGIEEQWQQACNDFKHGKSTALADLARQPIWTPRPVPERSVVGLLDDIEHLNDQMKLLLGMKVTGW